MSRSFLVFLLGLCAALLSPGAARADRGANTAALRALARIVTFNPAGDTLGVTQGFFVEANGTLIAPYAPFRGASRALVSDSRSRQGHVLRIVAANAELDLLRATTDLARRNDEYLPLSPEQFPVGTAFTLVPFAADGRPAAQMANVVQTESLRGHNYYTLSAANAASLAGLPLLTAEAKPRVAAIAQFNYGKAPSDGTPLGLCALAASAADTLRANAVAALSPDLTALRIPLLLPADENEAYTYLYMLLRSRRDSSIVATALADFLTAHPNHREATLDAARFYAARRNYLRADSLLDRALRISPDDESRSRVHEERAGLIIDALAVDSLHLPPHWRTAEALRALDRADSLAPRPSSALLRGVILYGQGRNREAFAAFERVNRSDAASLRSFFFAAQALSRAGGNDSAVVALLDSALAHTPTPFTAEAAAPLAWRAVYAERLGDQRRAVLDLVDYERLVPAAELAAPFFLRRAALAEQVRLYRRAVDDYTTAAARTADRETRIEALTAKALLCVRLSAGDEALAAAEELQRLTPDTPDALKLLGLAHQLLGHRAQARRYLSQAAAKGDANAAELLRKVK